jgi:hypothetical protein
MWAWLERFGFVLFVPGDRFVDSKRPLGFVNCKLIGGWGVRRPPRRKRAEQYRSYSPLAPQPQPIFGEMTRQRAEILLRGWEWFRKPDTVDVWDAYQFSLDGDPTSAQQAFDIFLERRGLMNPEVPLAWSLGLIDAKIVPFEAHKFLFFDLGRDYQVQLSLTAKGAQLAAPYVGPDLGFTPPKWSFVAATKAFREVTGIAPAPFYGPDSLDVKYDWEWRPTEVGIAAKRMYAGVEHSQALLRLYDDGWRVESY